MASLVSFKHIASGGAAINLFAGENPAMGQSALKT
jgi:hypothetical protein